jgi:hypothetical protein
MSRTYKRLRRVRVASAILVTAVLTPSTQAALTIDLDYTYDTGGFFTSGRRALMSQVASLFEARIEDTLSAIAPSGGNHWTIEFYNPFTGTTALVVDPTIALNTVRVYLGARNLGSGVLGVGGYGGVASGSGSGAFVNAVSTRGQSGVTSNTDFGPWGGSISFSDTASWYFDSDPTTVESFAGQNDFYSVAAHELGHLLGIGTADSWSHYVNGSHQFTGSAAVTSYGGNVPLVSADDHFNEGTLSTIAGTATSQEAAMDPTLTTGTRKYLTDLDWAALQDIGWQIAAIPEPSSTALLALGGVLFCAVSRLSRRNPPQ